MASRFEPIAVVGRARVLADALDDGLLHCGREALADAGIAGPARVDVVVSHSALPPTGTLRFAESVWLGGLGRRPDPRQRFAAGLPPALLARALGLDGAALAVDGSSASSLEGLRLACGRLHDRRADAVLVAAVNAADASYHSNVLQALGVAGPSGPLPAEGAVAVVVERLADAIERGGRVLGVVHGIDVSPADPPGSSLEPLGPTAGLLSLAEVLAAGDGNPRRVVIGAAGLAGNVVEVVVETPCGELARPERPAPAAVPEVAVVAVAVHAAGAGDAEGFAAAVFAGEAPPPGLRRRLPAVELRPDGLRFPPRELERTPGQQLLVFELARRAAAEVSSLPRRTGVWLGGETDPESARLGLRWRLLHRFAAEGSTAGGEEWMRTLADAVAPPLDAAAAAGLLPGMGVPRIARQLGTDALGCALSAGELSGIVALDAAVRALERGEVDAAVVGAVDFSCDPVHEAAAADVLPADRHPPGDAGVALVLMRAEDARRRGETVVALIDGVALGGPAPLAEAEVHFALGPGTPAASCLTPRFGHAHAASGLLHVAAAVLACRHRSRPSAEGRGSRPWLGRGGERRAGVEVIATGGAAGLVVVRQGPGSARPLKTTARFPRLHLYSAADRRELQERLDAGGPPDHPAAPGGPARLVLVADGAEELDEQRARAIKLFALSRADQPLPAVQGVYARDVPLEGELAFAFAGWEGAYRGMGRELLAAMPELVDRLGERIGDLEALAGWAHDPDRARATTPAEAVFGSSFLCQLHAELTLEVLGLRPDVVYGCSTGEIDSLLATGVWEDASAWYRDAAASGLLDRKPESWSTWVVQGPRRTFHRAAAGEPGVEIVAVHTAAEVVIGGEPEACRRVIAKIGAPAYHLGAAGLLHGRHAEALADDIFELCRRPTRAPAGLRFYTQARGGYAYHPVSESVARALQGQAAALIDFPLLVERAWNDGVRVFVEHGPKGLLSGYTRKVLGRRGISPDAYLAISLDRGQGGVEHTANALAQLLAAGVDFDVAAWNARAAAARGAPSEAQAPTLRFAAHGPPLAMPPWVAGWLGRGDAPKASPEVMLPEAPLPEVTRSAAVPTGIDAAVQAELSRFLASVHRTRQDLVRIETGLRRRLRDVVLGTER